MPDGAHDLSLIGDRTLLVAAPDFHGRALLSLARAKRTQIRNLAFDGNRAALGKPLPLPKPNQPFSRFYQNNGLLIEDSDEVTVSGVTFVAIPNFAVLVYQSRHVDLSRISVARSGSLNARGRNNTSGGILLEEGVEDFTIADCELREIRGNGIWTHSYANSPHNLRGRITGNRFLEIGRDAIQLGHSDGVTVKGNSGWRIGLRFSEVDVEGGGTPVAIDTAGTVENCLYENNRFEEVNGKCIDLDGFHDGIVRANTCINRGKPEAYPYGNFGISFNNTSTRMTSRNVQIEANTLDGMKYGGIFLIGSGHTHHPQCDDPSE